MPWGQLNLPSIGITQLKSILDQSFGDEVETELHYFNLKFARFFGASTYSFIATDLYSRYCNYGEWFFRQVAFPNLPDNKQAYYDHFNLHLTFEKAPDWPPFPRQLPLYVHAMEKRRPLLQDFLDTLILEAGLDKVDVVGFSSLFSQNIPVIAAARRIKYFNPNVVIVVGGANCESPMGEELVRQVDVIDFVFSGTALVSFPTFIEHLSKGDLASCKQIDGVFSSDNLENIRYESGLEILKHLPKGSQIASIGKELSVNELIPLDYDSFLDSSASNLDGSGITPYLLFETSRGCWWGEKAHCTFCGLNGGTMQFRSMAAEKSKVYLQDLLDRYGSKVVDFGATDNIMPKDIIDSVYGEMDLPEDIVIFYEIRADLSPEQLATMASSRITRVQPGIESLDAPTLKRMRKGATGTGNVAFMREAAQVGIMCLWNLLVGFPGEPEDPYFKYMDLMPSLFHLMPPSNIYMVRFDRYSPYFTQSEKYGLNLRPADFYSFLYPHLEEEQLTNLAYFFEDDHPDTYADYVRKWYRPIQKEVVAWNRRFFTEDDGLFPMLHFENESRIYDSRSGQLVYHDLSLSQVRMLELLQQPLSIGKLRNRFDVVKFPSFDEDLKYLIELGLIFHEDQKTFVSLVHRHPVHTFISNHMHSELRAPIS